MQTYPTCSVPWCDRQSLYIGLCTSHYFKRYRHGTEYFGEKCQLPPWPKHRKTSNTVEYKIWSNLKNRCLNPHNPYWPDYGGRGITVCDRWLTFENFFEDVGFRPEGRHGKMPLYTLDRVDNEGNYEPGNWRWATHTEQAQNRRPRRRRRH